MTTTKKAITRKRSTKKAVTLTPEERYLKIQDRAYLKAETDGFQKNSVEYWLAAEAEIG
jgi:hypothetical protein